YWFVLYPVAIQMDSAHLFFFQAEDGIRDFHVTGVQTCALPIYTAASVYGGLMAASRFADLFGDYDRSQHYRDVADRIKQGLLRRSEERRVGKECGTRGSR